MFAAALHDLMHELALWVVKDGEGLTKLIQIDVTGAESDAAARRIGFSIANSPLVKTAVAGGDPNWGRVVMAVGKAGEAADRDRLSITYGDLVVAKDGERAPTYDEKTVAAYMAGPRDRDRRRHRPRLRQGHGVDLRSHARLHLDQRRLSQLKSIGSQSAGNYNGGSISSTLIMNCAVCSTAIRAARLARM